ncbi:hypothetical protein [Aquipseudomonas alcaligenes]|uniref:Uncharacterized protein n=1 Tax=Aquipseudomonas alcaligenes TaxID=43263 RepID=A0AA42N6D9_AQUAC|nr:hypothetical protein [Pseudomonas alcaligenes]MDH1056931.1 hypothetical protein [Pseudomonas alcaligenes]
MARTVDTRWFETYRNVKKTFEEQGPSATMANVAQALNMNQKTLNRIVVAGRYLERCMPDIDPGAVRCSYVHPELLEKIARISPPLAEELLPSALVNQISIAELTQQLDVLRSQSPLLAHAINARSEKRRTAKGLLRDLFSFLAHTPLEFFEAPGGSVLKAAAPNLFQAPNAVVLDQDGKPKAALFCKVGGDSRPASGVAMELYELAVARRHMAPMVWMVFPERSEVLMHLAELSLWLGGSPLHEENWLRLAYFSDFGKRLELNVLFEKDFSELLAEVLADKRRFEPEQFSWAGIAPGEASGTTIIQIGYTPQLPEAKSSRLYSEHLFTAFKDISLIKRLAVEDDLGL